MSTRAIIAYTKPDGTWQGIWNHWSSDTQHLGRALIKEVSRSKGDLDQVVKTVILDAPLGWSSFVGNEKGDEDEESHIFAGAFDGIVATAAGEPDSLIFDTHLLYLFHAPKRRLYVFEMKEGPMRPFGIVTFDESGRAKPPKLPPIEE